MTKHYPQEFRDDVVKVARLHQISMRQVAMDFAHLIRNDLSVASKGLDTKAESAAIETPICLTTDD
jgi:hypothetical protein